MRDNKFTHFGKAFKKYAATYPDKPVKLYEAVCKEQNIPEAQITYTAIKVNCSSCLKVLRKRKETEIRNINKRLIELDYRENMNMEISL